MENYRWTGGANRVVALSVLLAIVLLIPAQAGHSAVQTVTGTTKLSNTLQYGNTAYSVDYSYPAVAQVGNNLTISVLLHVDSMTGLAEYILSYQIRAGVSIGTQIHLNGSVVAASTDPNLYPGSVWGPKNITIPLTAENTGLTRGTSANATVSITLDDTIKYGGQLSLYMTEPPMQGQAGTFLAQNSPLTTGTGGQGNGSTQSYLPYALLAAGAVLMLSSAVLFRAPGKQS